MAGFKLQIDLWIYMHSLSGIEILDSKYPEGLISKDEITLQPDLRLSVLWVSWVSTC